jgi:hypothetical protein
MMTARQHRFRLTVLAAGLLLAVGCSTGKRLYPVVGTVVYDDGKPAVELAKGTVSFESIEDQLNFAGDIMSDATFRIRTPTGREGAPAGTYRVVVLPPEGADRNRPPVDRQYGRYETSGIEITIEPKDNKISIPVKRPPRAGR